MKFTERNQDLIVKAGIGLLAYLILAKPVLNFLGITKGEGGKKAEAAGKDINSPFNPGLWTRLKLAPTADLNKRTAQAISAILFGLGLVSDDETRVIGAFKLMRSKAEVSYLSQQFNKGTGKDLVAYLMYGANALPQNGLSNDELNTIFTYINRLPVK